MFKYQIIYSRRGGETGYFRKLVKFGFPGKGSVETGFTCCKDKSQVTEAFRQPEAGKASVGGPGRGQRDVHPAQRLKGGPPLVLASVDITPASKEERNHGKKEVPTLERAGLPGASDQHDHLSPKAMGARQRPDPPEACQVSSWEATKEKRSQEAVPRLYSRTQPWPAGTGCIGGTPSSERQVEVAVCRGVFSQGPSTVNPISIVREHGFKPRKRRS